MELSIIIVNWNTRELLAQCLDSIYAHPPDCEFDTWIVDNASSDDSVQMLRENFPAVRLIENRENVGLARANNQAIQASTGTYLFFLNSDTTIQGDALSPILDFVRAHPWAGVVSAYLLNRDGTPQQVYSKFPSFWSETIFAFGLDARLSLWKVVTRDAANDWVRSDCVSGAAFVVPRAVLDAVGRFDENFFMYSEEIDLQLRVQRAERENGFLCSSPIVHLGGASTEQSAAAMKAELFQSKVYFFRKHHGRVSALGLSWVFKAGILGRVLRYHFLGDHRRKTFWLEVWKHWQTLESVDQPTRNLERESLPHQT